MKKAMYKIACVLSVVTLFGACGGDDANNAGSGDANAAREPDIKKAPANAAMTPMEMNDEMSTGVMCQDAEGCAYWVCSCEDGGVVNSRSCTNGVCLGPGAHCAKACEAFDSKWTGYAGEVKDVASNGSKGNSSNTNSSNTNSSSGNSSSGNSSSGNPSNGDSSDGGGLGSECSDSFECDSAYCRVPAGGFGGVCSVNDFGSMCEFNSDCEYGACYFAEAGDVFGYCTATCESFTDCPDFWSCEAVGNASGSYCVNN